MTLAHGGENIYDGWMKNPKSAMINCNDGQVSSYSGIILFQALRKLKNTWHCKDLFVFSINTPKLIDYYTNRLGFKEIENLDDKLFFEYAVPDYDDSCKFLYFPLS